MKVKSLLNTFTDLGCYRDHEVEQLFKSVFDVFDGVNAVFLTCEGLTNTFGMSTYKAAVKFVNSSVTKQSFIAYRVTIDVGRPMFITFFKTSDTLKYIEFLNTAIVSKVLNS